MSQTFTIVVQNDGTIGFFADDGSFQEGATNIAQILKAIQTSGLTLDEIGQVENHRDPSDRILSRLHDEAHLGLYGHTHD